MWLPAVLILGLVGGIVVLALLFAKDPPPEDERAGGPTPLDRFLADARGDRQTRSDAPPPRAIPTARPRSRTRQQPVAQKPAEQPTPMPAPTPLPPPGRPVVIIHREPEPVIVVPIDVPPQPIEVPATTRRNGSPAARRLAGLLHDRDTLQVAFLLNEVLQRRPFPRPLR